METLHDLTATTAASIALANDALAQAQQARTELRSKRDRIRAATAATLEKYPLL